ncbi:MAG: trypsin-like peptidase domain-containing protein [Bacteroidota bacterium]
MNRAISLLSFLFFNIAMVTGQDIASIYAKVNPAVVTITTKQKAISQNNQVAYQGSIGSGVMISDNGDILTASHVVNNAESIKVKFIHGEEIPAKVIRSAPIADLALIHLSWLPKKSVVATIGDSDQVAIGDQIMVIGAPFGIEHSLSVGYIAGKKGRKNQSLAFDINEFFQTDAAINQGNSGGPMFNLKGEVIGISSYIVSQSGGFQGVGYAATSNLAKKTVIDGNTRWSGIKGFLLSETLAWLLNSPITGGLLVESVVNLSPADFAGLKGGFKKLTIEDQEIILGGDIILSINEIPLTNEGFEKIVRLLNEDSANTKNPLELQVLRGGKIEHLTFQFKH